MDLGKISQQFFSPESLDLSSKHQALLDKLTVYVLLPQMMVKSEKRASLRYAIAPLFQSSMLACDGVRVCGFFSWEMERAKHKLVTPSQFIHSTHVDLGPLSVLRFSQQAELEFRLRRRLHVCTEYRLAAKMNSLRAASAAYLNDDKFSDFIIVCGEKEYNVHRCFIAAHSKWVGRCCSGTFAEGIHRKVELKEDIPLAVERMIEYFYKLDYDETPSDNGTGYAEAWSHHPIFPMQLSAHMYAIADKYEVAELKDLALKKFKNSSLSVITDKAHLMGAAYAIYEWIEMPDSDRALKDILIDMWIVGSLELKATAHELLNLPKFAADLSARLLEGFS